MSHRAFGEFFKECRIKSAKTLRQFCLENGFDPGNLSRLERGRLPPPQSEVKLREYAEALAIKQGSDDWYQFFDLAAAERGRLPRDILNDAELVKELPLLFRTIRNRKPTKAQLLELAELLRRA